MFKIRAVYYNDINNEVLEVVDTYEKAQMLAFEYQIAYGPKWLIYVEEQSVSA